MHSQPWIFLHTHSVVFKPFFVHVDDVRADAVEEILRMRNDHKNSFVSENIKLNDRQKLSFA